MPTFRDSQTVAAGATVTNIMAGSKFEFLPRPSVIKVYSAQDTGTGSVELDFTLGNVVVGDDLGPNVVTAGTGPARDSDLLTQGAGAAGDRIQIRLREVGGATATPVRTLVEIIELA